MKKVQKITTILGRKITLIVSEDLNKLKGKNHAPEKLEEANRTLGKIKEWPPEFPKK
jgi:hypothetical protein